MMAGKRLIIVDPATNAKDRTGRLGRVKHRTRLGQCLPMAFGVTLTRGLRQRQLRREQTKQPLSQPSKAHASK